MYGFQLKEPKWCQQATSLVLFIDQFYCSPEAVTKKKLLNYTNCASYVRIHQSSRTRSSVHEYLSCKINCKTKHKSHALYQGHGRLASRLGTDPDQTLIGSLYHAHTSRVNNFFMSYMYRQLRWSWYMDKLPNQQVNYFHEKLPRVFALGQNLVRSSVFWYPGENAREIWLQAILREMRTRRVCVTAQSKSSYCMIAGQKVSLRCCKNQAVGRNLSLPYIPLSLPATLLQNTVCVFQNSIWPLTIPVSEYPSAELSFSLKVGK